MANHQSAIKRIRSSKKRQVRNKYQAKTMRNALKAIRSITNKQEASKELPSVMSMLDTLAKKNLIHKRKAANLKSGLMKSINALS